MVGIARDRQTHLSFSKRSSFRYMGLRSKPRICAAHTERRNRNTDDVNPEIQVLSKRPSSTSLYKSRFVAAMTRARNGTSLSLPTGRTVRASSARSNLACMPAGMSPISSRNRVPDPALTMLGNQARTKHAGLKPQKPFLTSFVEPGQAAKHAGIQSQRGCRLVHSVKPGRNVEADVEPYPTALNDRRPSGSQPA